MEKIKKSIEIINLYNKHAEVRAKSNIPPLPLNPEQTEAVCNILASGTEDRIPEMTGLLKHRVSPGVDPSAKVKADFLGRITGGELSIKGITEKEAVDMLGTMMGGYNVKYLISALGNEKLAENAAEALSKTILVYDDFITVSELSEQNKFAEKVIRSWADGKWFLEKEELPSGIKVKIYKVDGEINTDDFSPASDAWSRPDIPLHALSMGRSKFPEGIETISKWREEGHIVAFAGDVVGTGSSRKSATNSLLWHIGDDIPFVPNKRRKGIVLGGVIAPIFFNTLQDSGGLPITTDVTKLKTGDEIVINMVEGTIKKTGSEEVLSTFEISPATLSDEYRAGGRIPLIIGRSLTEKAEQFLKTEKKTIFREIINPEPSKEQKFTLAQKIVGKACGFEGVLPGTSCEPFMTTVGSQDTTGPMTADELKELACLKFQTPMFMQSFCHTAAYPRPADIKMHKTLPGFITEREGVSLKPGDGVIHTWLNRFLLPDTVGTGGDSHTRFPLGISFPAGSGLVAFAGALGFMPLDMPESVLVRFNGKMRPGITLRDVVNAIPYFAIQEGLLTVPKKNKKNIFNGKIIEIEGMPDITVEQAFELMDATAERSAAAGTIKLSEKSVADYLRSNSALLSKLIEDGYKDSNTIQKRINDINSWLENPELLSADPGCEYSAVLEIDLSDITEPILSCPNDPDDVKLLSEVSGTKIDDVFLGSCMTNIGHFRAAGRIWENQKRNPEVRVYLDPPTRMDQNKLKDEGYFSLFNTMGSRIEVPGCSLCMGNQLRVPDKAAVYSTSTRNFDNRMGTGAQVFLGSAELGALVALKGKIPMPEEYFKTYNEKIAPHEDEIYNYLQFDNEYK
ncbi:MAG: bifunctional aconitate hydratase 2/2-methylisocitrate dehydratase [Acidobacteriota bacterium]